MYMILMLLIQELPYLYFLVIFLFFLVRLFYNATSTDAGKHDKDQNIPYNW